MPQSIIVRLLCDAIESTGLDKGYVSSLRDAGAKVADPRSAPGSPSRFRINVRNQRKTVFVDRKTPFTGGLNVSDEYLGLDPALELGVTLMSAWADPWCPNLSRSREGTGTSRPVKPSLRRSTGNRVCSALTNSG